METLEFGLCEFTLNTLDNFQLHPFTCETFKCLDCGKKDKAFDNKKISLLWNVRGSCFMFTLPILVKIIGKKI